jgi:small multidrug resistance pump
VQVYQVSKKRAKKENKARIVSSILVFIFAGFSFAAFTLALKRIELSFDYAVWTGLGVLLISTTGIPYFKESVNVLKIISIIFIVCGVVGLHVSGIAS